MFKEQLKSALLVFIILTVITGILYPLFITGIAQVLFHAKADGSLIYRDGKITGSAFIGQQFDDPKYLWGRISATSPVAYNASSSSGSNIGPSNPALLEAVKARIEKLRAADPKNRAPIPVDLVTSSASGLDPHISPSGAYYQIVRIAKQRRLSVNIVRNIIDRNTTPRLFGMLGEPVVNVLKVNLDLDSYRK
ncbi:MAG: potassium-transporting ATPase subunit KdpC [Candidatus Omnitrophica bacterium]|nr:potassium-transporting ATPase subunit KdpC [Candidatus Omnitrophota bacterium]